MASDIVSKKDKFVKGDKYRFGIEIERFSVYRLFSSLRVLGFLQIPWHQTNLFALTLKRNLIIELEKKIDRSLSDTLKRELLGKLEGFDNGDLEALLSAIIITEVYLDNTSLRNDVENVCLSLYKDVELGLLDTIYIKVKLKTDKSVKEIWPIWRSLRNEIDSKIKELFGEKGLAFVRGLRLAFER